ncbi:Alpha/beta hydrolase fold-1 [Dillenia turbinata]|uniref:Alpha/beta hydrolase fold-1 n=1 Tax=Dillenia turbinata TaxID=194707 RepID=A0AAN8WC07_9MAGN
MSEVRGGRTWQEELASLVEDTGIIYPSNQIGVTNPIIETRKLQINSFEQEEGIVSESLKDQVKGFMKAWGELLVELAKGCRDIVLQNIVNEESFVVQRLRGPCSKAQRRLRFLNEYLPEDKDPVHAWPVILFVFFLALAVMNVNIRQGSSLPLAKKVYIHPPSATHIQLPDGRHMAYHELGVSADKARYSLIAPHSFLSSRLAGIPGIKTSLLADFGVRLITYDLPGFGESDPHPNRDLNSSALDMLFLANAVHINDKFWVLGFSGGSMHAWAALRYIPDRIAGAALFAPLVNPYESGMTKEERSSTWEKWTSRRKLMFFLARKFPKLLSYFYRQSFLSGKHGQIDNWFSLSLGRRPVFEEFWHRDVEESIRQWNTKPFVEEAALQVNNWGFSLADLQVQKKCNGKGILPWLKSIYTRVDCELMGFSGPIHIWQGLDDQVNPPSLTEFVGRILPGAILHKLPDEGHFSYFYFCDECHREIFSLLFGKPQGPLDKTVQTLSTPVERNVEDRTSL